MTVQSLKMHGAALGESAKKDASTYPDICSSDDDGQQRLIVVSNRVADLSSSAQSGGLAVGLADAIRRRGGIWFGWNGEREGETGGPLNIRKFGSVTCIGAPISPDDFAAYYLGFANSVLWPLLHYRLDLVDYNSASYQAYLRVNQSFARRLFPMLKPDDVIWVHDYHLIPLAHYLRQLGCKQRIGHFLHIPFPPPDFLSAIPKQCELVDNLLQYDLLGFQTYTDVENVKSLVKKVRPSAVCEGATVSFGSRNVRIGRFPIGINGKDFALQAEHNCDPEKNGSGQSRTKRKRIIGIDRLDYSKGLPERFQAFDELLTRYPQVEKKVSYLQIAPPTRGEVAAYADMRVELERMAGSINGRFADLDWTPVQYICRSLPRQQLAPLMRHSEVGFVTPLRDGMNLVAKEYVAAQDPEDPGVLVLSQFAGAAEEMREALIVNPYDTGDMATQLYRALSMPLKERRSRHAALLKNVIEHDSQAWLTSYLTALTQPQALPKHPMSST